MVPPIWQIERYPELDSTNALAIEWVRSALTENKEAPAGLVIIAERQRSGRGQHNRRWESPPGGLYLSAVISDLPENLRNRLALFVGVAVANALEDILQFPNTVALRWPNDITLHHKKAAGVLCESVAMGNHWAAIIGIGVNVTTDLANLSEDLRARATSLYEISPQQITLQKVETQLLTSLSSVLGKLQQNGGASLIARAQQLDELRGQQITLQTNDQTLTGTAAGISDFGELLLQLGPPPAPPTPFLTGSILRLNGIPLRS